MIRSTKRFHANGFSSSSVVELPTNRSGPTFSNSQPRKDDPPGPPLRNTTTSLLFPATLLASHAKTDASHVALTWISPAYCSNGSDDGAPGRLVIGPNVVPREKATKA